MVLIRPEVAPPQTANKKQTGATLSENGTRHEEESTPIIAKEVEPVLDRTVAIRELGQGNMLVGSGGSIEGNQACALEGGTNATIS